MLGMNVPFMHDAISRTLVSVNNQLLNRRQRSCTAGGAAQRKTGIVHLWAVCAVLVAAR